LHKDKAKLAGVIGFVSQDDLLIEDLTVFQNLYFNAQLCFSNLKDTEVIDRVMQTLMI
jgi:ABC-type multidrug transport system ATPase subunit